MTTDTHWARVGALELEIEHADSDRLSAPGGPGPGGERECVTGLLALHGAGHAGLGEDVGLMEPGDYDTFAELARSLPLAGRWTVASLAAHLRTNNDVAPSAFNLPETPPGIPASPLVPREEISGFRWQ